MALPFFNSKVKRRDHIVVFDLGTRTTKAIYLQRKGNGYALMKYTIQEAPIYEKKPSPELLADHFKVVSQALSARTKQVILVVSPADSMIRQADMPMIPIPDLRTMLKLNPKAYLQQDMPNHVFDCYLLPVGDKPAGAEGAKVPQKCKVMVGGAKKELIDDLQAAAKGAGLVVDQIVPNLVGPANALEMAQPEVFQKEVVALVDLGFKSTTISILLNGQLMLNRVMGLGGDKLTAGLAEAMNIGYAEAEGIKMGLAQEVEGMLQTLVAPLGRELRASVDFFEHQQDKTISQVFVSGGACRPETVVQALQSELMVPCKTWNPTSFLEIALPPEQLTDFEQAAPQLVVAVGAAAVAFE